MQWFLYWAQSVNASLALFQAAAGPSSSQRKIAPVHTLIIIGGREQVIPCQLPLPPSLCPILHHRVSLRQSSRNSEPGGYESEQEATAHNALCELMSEGPLAAAESDPFESAIHKSVFVEATADQTAAGCEGDSSATKGIAGTINGIRGSTKAGSTAGGPSGSAAGAPHSCIISNGHRTMAIHALQNLGQRGRCHRAIATDHSTAI